MNGSAYYTIPKGRGYRPMYQHRWPWTTLNPKIGVLVDFSRF